MKTYYYKLSESEAPTECVSSIVDEESFALEIAHILWETNPCPSEQFSLTIMVSTDKMKYTTYKVLAEDTIRFYTA